VQTRERLRTKFLTILQQDNLTTEARADLLLEVARPEVTLTAQQAMVSALAQVMDIDSMLNGARLATLGSLLFKRGGTPELVRSKYGRGGWYYSTDWRGKRGELPNEKSVRETWGRWESEAVKSSLGPYREED